jgi:hypothetical protein
MSVPLKHHHLPVFYLNRWTGKDGRLCQFSRPHKDIVADRKHPAQTGYVERLYEIPGLPPENAQLIEDDFMQRLDSHAAAALTMLEDDDPRITREATGRKCMVAFYYVSSDAYFTGCCCYQERSRLRNGHATSQAWKRGTQPKGH